MDVPSQLAQEAVYFRGLFVHRHSGVEYAINELLVRARLLDEYASIGNLPFKFESRLRLVKRLLAMPGPLGKYEAVFADAITRYREYTPHRRLMVHGLMGFPDPASPDQRIRFAAYAHQEGRLHLTELQLTITELKELAEALFSISGVIPGLVSQIITEVPLPQVAMAGPPTDLWGQPQGSPLRF